MKAMILAAGRGERMGHLTQNTPKPLLKVAGKPLLKHHIDRLLAAGFTEIVINASYLGEQLEAYVAGLEVAANIQVIVEPARLETGGGIFNALSLLGDKSFVVLNGDVWTDYPLTELTPLAQNILAHLVMVDNPPHNPGGDFVLSNQRITVEAGQRLTFSGLSVLSPALFAGQTAGRFPLAPILRQAIAENTVSGEHYRGAWTDVGTPERLAYIEAKLRS